METYDKVLDDLSPEKKRENWDTAFGLQAVDNLRPSKYMQDLANQHIEGEKSYYEVSEELQSYYKKNSSTQDNSSNEKEADIVSEAIYAILSDESFSFDIPTFKSYHRRLFEKLDKNVFSPGEFRTVNITKKEPILGGDTVQYQDFGMLEESLEYDFNEEKEINYLDLSDEEKIARFATFTSRIWQVHPFLEGNTRTTATFIQKYLMSLGYETEKDVFRDNAVYFRNALVRANYSNLPRNVTATDEYLIKFFKVLLKKANLVLDNNELYIK